MIPPQLQDSKFRFCLILPKLKKPFEDEWQNGGYSFNDSTLIDHIASGGNYGVMTGIPEGFAILDSEDEVLSRLFEANFGETFTVQSGRPSCKGRHHYVFITGLTKKIIFERIENNVAIHYGELQYKGQQCVGAGSIHPSGNAYKVVKDLPVKRINYTDFAKVFEAYIKVKPEPIIQDWKKSEWKGDRIAQIPITNIFSVGGMVKRGSTIQGSHPIHGSTTGQNFVLDTHQNTWYCFRHNTGGGIWTALAVSEGLVSCDDCVKGYTLSSDVKSQIAQLVKDKYGLKGQEPEQTEPKGWAKAINIKVMAERNNVTSCKCGMPFNFNEQLATFECTKCGKKGNIFDFVIQIRGAI